LTGPPSPSAVSDRVETSADEDDFATFVATVRSAQGFGLPFDYFGDYKGPNISVSQRGNLFGRWRSPIPEPKPSSIFKKNLRKCLPHETGSGLYAFDHETHDAAMQGQRRNWRGPGEESLVGGDALRDSSP
jgi:hypothetical protein